MVLARVGRAALLPAALLPAALLVASSCARPLPPEALIERVELAGCRDIRPGPVCEVEGPTTLTMWVGAPADARLAVGWGSARSPVSWSPVEGGQRARLAVTSTTTELVVEATRRGVDRVRWRVEVRPRDPALVEIDALLASEGASDQAEAERRLAALAQAAPSRVSSEAERMLGALASRRGDLDAALGHWRASAALATAAGLPSRAANERMSAAYVAVDNARQLQLARQLLQEVEDGLDAHDAVGRAHLAYYRAMLATHLGDLRTAIGHLDAADGGARRLGLERLAWIVDHWRSSVLGALGQHAAALQLLDALEAKADAARPCDRAGLSVARTWVGLSAVESGDAAPPGLRQDAERALELYTTTCPDPGTRANMHLNLALLELQASRPEAAAQHLVDARAGGVEQVEEQRLWLYDLEGRRALAQGRAAEALVHFDRLRAGAADTGAAAATWRSMVGRAAALTALGRIDEAREAYASSRRTLQTESLAVSLGAWRTHFLASRRRATQAELELLLRLDAPAAAVGVIRQARADALRSLTRALRLAAAPAPVKAHWDLAVARHSAAQSGLEALSARAWGRAAESRPADEAARSTLQAERGAAIEEALASLASHTERPLEPLAPGADEAIIGYFPLSGSGTGIDDTWLGFAVTRRGTVVRRLGALPADPDRERQAEVLLAPFDALIGAAASVRFLVEGRVADLDLHALSWRGRPLLSARRVRYGLDLPPVEGALAPAWLVVSDPLGDLPGARDEAADVLERLTAHGRSPRALAGRAATRAAVLAGLREAGGFHFAGHGRPSQQSGLDASLRLADGGELSLGDVLLLDRVPARVILASCETARTVALAGPQVGVAQAFVIAGAREVVAATRPVDDALARTLVNSLYAEEERPLDLALQQAQVTAASATPGSDWAAFRVFVR